MMMPGAGVTVLSEVAERLMMIFGAGALTCATKCGRTAFSRLTKVAQPPSQRDIAGDTYAGDRYSKKIRPPSAGPIRSWFRPPKRNEV